VASSSSANPAAVGVTPASVVAFGEVTTPASPLRSPRGMTYLHRTMTTAFTVPLVDANPVEFGAASVVSTGARSKT
jgi:hypothetical protein